MIHHRLMSVAKKRSLLNALKYVIDINPCFCHLSLQPQVFNFRRAKGVKGGFCLVVIKKRSCFQMVGNLSFLQTQCFAFFFRSSITHISFLLCINTKIFCLHNAQLSKSNATAPYRVKFRRLERRH